MTGWRRRSLIIRLPTSSSNPHNPVGRIHTPEELAALARLADRFGVTIISDEIHAPLVLPGGRFTPMLTVPGGADVAISLLSASKAFNLAGLKCAAAVTGSPVMRAVTDRLPDELRWRFGHFGLLATITALQTGDDWLDRLILTLDRRRNHLGTLLSQYLPLIEWTPPAATYLAWLDCRELGPGSSGRDIFLERGRVALEPGPRFGPLGSGFVRLNFATSADVLEEGVRRMSAALR